MQIRILTQKRYQLGFDNDYFNPGNILDIVHELGLGFHARRANSPKSPLVFIPYSGQNKDYQIVEGESN